MQPRLKTNTAGSTFHPVAKCPFSSVIKIYNRKLPLHHTMPYNLPCLIYDAKVSHDLTAIGGVRYEIPHLFQG